MPPEINNFYIDDSIFDKTNYPPTWLEEDKWPNYGMVSPYIIDSNLIKIGIKHCSLSSRIDIVQDDVKEKHLEDKAHEESKAELSVDDSKCEDDGKSKLDSSVPTEVDPFEESIKQDVKDMSYSQLCELAKARNIKTKGKVSRTKLIKLLSDDLA